MDDGLFTDGSTTITLPDGDDSVYNSFFYFHFGLMGLSNEMKLIMMDYF